MIMEHGTVKGGDFLASLVTTSFQE